MTKKTEKAEIKFLQRVPESIGKINQRFHYVSPFLSEIMFRAKWNIDDKMPFVAAVGPHRGGFRISINQQKFEELPELQREGVLLHEIEHVLNIFFDRLGSRELKIFNIAQDIPINDEVETTEIGHKRLELPDWVWRAKSIRDKGYTGPLISEHIYEWMMQNKDKFCGGAGGQGAGEGDPQQLDGHELMQGASDIDMEMTKEIIKGILRDAEARGWGDTPDSIKKRVKDILYPQVSWKKELRAAVNPMFGNGNITMETWRRPNRRGIDGVQGKRFISSPVAVWCDVSGSTYCTPKTMEAFMTEMESMSKDADDMIVGQFDTEVKLPIVKYKRGDYKKFEFTGGGGTSVQCIFDYMKDKKMKHYPVVIFTDGEFDFNFNAYNMKVIWVSTHVVGIPGGKNIKLTLEGK